MTTAASVHDLTLAAELLHGYEEVVYGYAGSQCIPKWPDMAGNSADFRVAMRPCKRRAHPETADGKLQDLIETVKPHIRSNVEHPSRVIKQQFGFQKARLRRLAKKRCKINVMAALANLYLALVYLLPAV